MTISNDVLSFWDKPSFEDQQRLIAGSVEWKASEDAAAYHRALIESPSIKEYMDGCVNPTVLEIGCGVGRILKGWPYPGIGVDLSPNMIEKAKEYLKGTKNDLLITDGATLLVPDNFVNFVYSFLVFQHIQTKKEVAQYIDEALRVLKPGGYLRVQTHKGTPHPENKFGGFHGRFYPTVEAFAEEFMRPEFEILSCQEKLGHDDWLWITVRKHG